MAVDINTVYQRVLAIANKEQRGYITPQEFNLFANQAQMKIFEQYFYDVNQFSRVPGNDTGIGDMLSMLAEKIAEFEVHGTSVGSGTTLPTDLYKIMDLYYTDASSDIYPLQRITKKEVFEYRLSKLPIVSSTKPVYIQNSTGVICYSALSKSASTAITSGVAINYIKKPASATWGYNVIVGQALYNSAASTDFELHPSEETSLVNEILELAGIMMEKPGLVNIANAEEDKKVQQEKS